MSPLPAPSPMAGLVRPVRRGFTLIECLAVAAIIAVLAVLTFPMVAKARASAESAKSLAGMREIGKSLLNFAAESGGDIPMAFGWPNLGGIYQKPASIKPGELGSNWPDDMWVWALVNTQGVPISAFLTPARERQLKAQGLPQGERQRPAWVVNQIVCMSEVDVDRGFFTKNVRLQAPSRYIMLSEACYTEKTKGLEPWLYTNWWGDWGLKFALWNEEDGAAVSNFIFADGHAESLKAKDTVEETTSRWLDPAKFPNSAWQSDQEFSSWLRRQTGL